MVRVVTRVRRPTSYWTVSLCTARLNPMGCDPRIIFTHSIAVDIYFVSAIGLASKSFILNQRQIRAPVAELQRIKVWTFGQVWSRVGARLARVGPAEQLVPR